MKANNEMNIFLMKASIKEKEKIQHRVTSSHALKVSHRAPRRLQGPSIFYIPNGTSGRIHHAVVFKITNG
jgi:hypothetical protein